MAEVPPDTWQQPNTYLETSLGIIVLELCWKHAPKACKNFAKLVWQSYYNGTKFHRIIKDLMIQGGEPTGTGQGGTSIYGKQLKDELHPDLKFTEVGIRAMAKAGQQTCHFWPSVPGYRDGASGGHGGNKLPGPSCG